MTHSPCHVYLKAQIAHNVTLRSSKSSRTYTSQEILFSNQHVETRKNQTVLWLREESLFFRVRERERERERESKLGALRKSRA